MNVITEPAAHSGNNLVIIIVVSVVGGGVVLAVGLVMLLLRATGKPKSALKIRTFQIRASTPPDIPSNVVLPVDTDY